MKRANNAPVYTCVYAELAEIARAHGYALAVHGSVGRDFDLIAIPWTDEAVEPQAIIDAITGRFVFRVIGEPENKQHGRIAYTISFGFGDVAIDLSFMPRVALNG